MIRVPKKYKIFNFEIIYRTREIIVYEDDKIYMLQVMIFY